MRFAAHFDKLGFVGERPHKRALDSMSFSLAEERKVGLSSRREEKGTQNKLPDNFKFAPSLPTFCKKQMLIRYLGVFFHFI